MCVLWLSPGSDILTDKPWTLLYIFCIFCPDLVIVEMGMRSEDVQAGQPRLSGQTQPHTFTLYYRVLTSLRPGLVTGNIDIYYLFRRDRERQADRLEIVITHDLTPCIRLLDCSGLLTG